LSERFFLYVVEDGEWHRLEDVAEELGISVGRVRDAAEYLAKGKFIHYDRDKGEVKIQDWLKKLPRGEWEKPGVKSTGTVVISRGGNVTIQGTTIYNESEQDLELMFLVADGELKEVTINRLPETKNETSLNSHETSWKG